MRWLWTLRTRLGEVGASGVEYALLLGFIAMIAVSAVMAIGGSTAGTARALDGPLDGSEAPAPGEVSAADTGSTAAGATTTTMTCPGNSGSSSGRGGGLCTAAGGGLSR